MKKKSAYEEMEDRHRKELQFYSSKRGRELELCLVAQGYEINLMGRFTILLGSGFSALIVIKNIREDLK